VCAAVPGDPSPSPPDKPRYSEGGEALLDAAVRVFSVKGVAGLTYRAVAAEAQVTHGLVGYHFGSREALVHATIARVAQNSVEQSAFLPESGRREDFLRELPAMTEADPDGAAAQFDLVVLGHRDPALLEEARGLYRQYIAVTGEALERLGASPDEATSRLIFAAIDGLILQQVLFGKPEETAESLEVLRRLLATITD
jgi:TetR/AcrR family transcriptional regulator, regulator of biofilm formation and stress response